MRAQDGGKATGYSANAESMLAVCVCDSVQAYDGHTVALIRPECNKQKSSHNTIQPELAFALSP